MARCVPTGLWLAEVPSTTRTFPYYLHSDSHQGSLVSVHHVGEIRDLQVIRTGTLAVEILVETLVYTHHGDVDTDLFLNLGKFEKIL